MNQLIIRKATPADMHILLQFEQGVIAAERPFDTALRTDHIQYYDLEAMIHSPHIELLVATLDGQVTGTGYARIEKSKHFLRHAQHAYLGFMFTHPDHRGKGINLAIIEALTKWAAARQVYECRLEVYAENSAAIKAYEKAGFKSLMLEMRLSL